ncbi:Two-component system response regulator protein [hydrothermal vent metagenome]|uniref:Two-component system response regulator protein n=1 Tax=hydrothermal vent metagenome TaxID=652676 RepID=A0A3B1AZM1_9ZZZZ
MRILIIEDDAELAAALADYLELRGAECDFAYHGVAGVQAACEFSFDVIILDLMLPKMSGFDVCQKFRSQGCNTPVLMLTASDTHSDQLEGFRAGIDDYVIKPCPMPLVWARLQVLHKRSTLQAEELSVGGLTLYLQEHRVTRDGREIRLTPTGWKILKLLMSKSPNVVPRTELEDHIWPDGNVDTGNFNVQLHQLRKAVDKPFSRPLIHTLVGVGLCLREEGDQDGH